MKNFDVFKYYPQFTVKQEDGMKTSVGGFSTILLGMLILAFSYISGSDLFYKRNPKIIESTNENVSPYLSRNDLFIAYAISDKQGKSIPDMEKYFNITFGYLIADNSYENNTEYKQFNSEKCYLSSKVFKENTNELLSKLANKPESFYCAPDKLNVDLNGVYGEKSFNVWDIRLTLCKNTTDNNNYCSSEEERERIFNQFFGIVFINSRKIDYSNYTNPIESSYISFLQRISIYSSRQDIFTINKMILLDDSGFLFTNINEKSNYAYESRTSDFMLGFDTGYIHRVILTLSDTTVKIKRSYKKLQDIATNIGGMFQFLIVSFAYINNSFSKVSYLDYLSNIILTNKNSYYINWEKVVYKQRKNNINNSNKDNINAITRNVNICSHYDNNSYRISSGLFHFKAFDSNVNHNYNMSNNINQYSNIAQLLNKNNTANNLSYNNNYNLFQNERNDYNDKNYLQSITNITKIVDTSKNINTNKDYSNINIDSSHTNNIANNSNLLLINSNSNEHNMNKLNNRIILMNNNEDNYQKSDINIYNDTGNFNINSNMNKVTNVEDKKKLNKELSDEEPKYSYKRYNTLNYYDTYHNLNDSENRDKYKFGNNINNVNNLIGKHTANFYDQKREEKYEKYHVDQIEKKNDNKYFSFKPNMQGSNTDNKQAIVDKTTPEDNNNKQNTNILNTVDFNQINSSKNINYINNTVNNNTKDNIVSENNNNKNKSRNFSKYSTLNKDMLDKKKEIDEIYHIISNHSLLRQFLEYYLCCKFKSKRIKKQILNRVKNSFAIESYINIYEDIILFKSKLIKNVKDFESIKWNNIITTMFTNKDPKIDNWYKEALKNC